MGMDLESIPVRLDAPAVRRIRRDPEVWEVAYTYPPFGSLRPGEELPEISRELLPSFADGHKWTWSFPDRSYEQAEYLLDPPGHRAIRGWEQRQRSLPFRIVQGDERFAEHATATQGMHLRCSTASFLTEAVATIDGLDVAAARREFSVADMFAEGVYKVHPEADDEEVFGRVLGHLRALADHYRRTAAEGFDLLILVD